MTTIDQQHRYLPDVDEDLVTSIRIGVMRLGRRLRFERTADQLSSNQLAVLGALHREGELTVGELAAAERVKPPSMTRTVNSLEEAGLVSRRSHATDGRQVLVGLTSRAEAVIAETQRRRDAWLATQLADLTDDERALLKRVAPLLDRLAHS